MSDATPLQQLAKAAAAIGPYLMLEVLMPGGTLFAFLLYIYRRKFAANS
jgi:hypothetical protein